MSKRKITVCIEDDQSSIIDMVLHDDHIQVETAYKSFQINDPNALGNLVDLLTEVYLFEKT